MPDIIVKSVLREDGSKEIVLELRVLSNRMYLPLSIQQAEFVADQIIRLTKRAADGANVSAESDESDGTPRR